MQRRKTVPLGAMKGAGLLQGGRGGAGVQGPEGEGAVCRVEGGGEGEGERCCCCCVQFLISPPLPVPI